MVTRAIGLIVILAVLIAIPFLARLPGCVMHLPPGNSGMPGEAEDAAGAIDAGTKSGTADIADGLEEDWMLILVNQKHPIPQGYIPELSQLDGGLYFDARAVDDLNAMLSDASAQGLVPVVISAYRTHEKQSRLFMDKVISLMEEGCSRELAEEITRKTIAYPGYSEHQTGLAVDIASAHYPYLEEKVAETPEIQWLTENCSKYGFILRYPKGKEDITGIRYEPWHFRYVGKPAAHEIMARGITLEEYLMAAGL